MFESHFKVSGSGKVSVEFVHAVTQNTCASDTSQTGMSNEVPHNDSPNKRKVTKMLLDFKKKISLQSPELEVS